MQKLKSKILQLSKKLHNSLMHLISGEHLCEYITLAVWYFHYFWLSAFSLHHTYSLLCHSNTQPTNLTHSFSHGHVAYKPKMKIYNLSIFREKYLDFEENWLIKNAFTFSGHCSLTLNTESIRIIEPLKTI